MEILSDKAFHFIILVLWYGQKLTEGTNIYIQKV